MASFQYEGQQAQDLGRADVQFDSEGRKKPVFPFEGKRNSLLLGRVSLFVLFRPSTDWVRLTQIKESNLLYSVYQFE